MPSSPIMKDITLPDKWVHLQKTIIPDQATASYWSVWFDAEAISNEPVVREWSAEERCRGRRNNGTAWLMWCPFGDDPSLNDNWGHVEDLDGDCKNALTAIESVYGVSFHESVWKEISPAQTLKDNPIV